MVSSQTPVAQETGFRFPGVEAAKQQDGAEKDLRAGRFSQGAEAGIVIGTLCKFAHAPEPVLEAHSRC